MKIAPCLALVLLAAGALAQEPAPPKYACEGFAEPLHRPGVMELRPGRVLPLKVRLVAPGGANVDDKVATAPVVSLRYKPADGPESDLSDQIEVWDFGKGKSFIYLADPDPHWKFDLGTGKLRPGQYTVTLVSGDAKAYAVDPACRLEFQLSK